MVEYELPMGLLHPTKQLMRRQSREQAVEEVVSIIEAEMALYKNRVEAECTRSGREARKNSDAWKTFHLTKPLVRPAGSRFQELFPWIKEVVWETFTTEEMLAAIEKP